ncbi:beta-N-acetylhexosaminidase [Bifidobacterium jacchi]|nr:glycoside hydrolase family 20 zincin-like fold domain-containing protein [Bifidobacterium jacchi]
MQYQPSQYQQAEDNSTQIQPTQVSPTQIQSGQYRTNRREIPSFDLIPQPQSVRIAADAAPVALPAVGRIAESRDIDDNAAILPTQLADDIAAVTGLRWDIAKNDRSAASVAASASPHPHTTDAVSANAVSADAAAVAALPDTLGIPADAGIPSEATGAAGATGEAAGTAYAHARWHAFIRLSIADSADPADAADSAVADSASTTDPAPLAPQEYRLTIAPTGIDIVGGDTAGVRNGVQTLRQIIRQCAPALPQLTIQDKPAYATRGYYLDATRGRVPTLAWLKRWADELCLYKYNQLQLYFEHTFLFDGLSETWRGTSPLKPADIIAFDEYCAERGIELVPSVSTFGHHYMALRTRELRALGEFPEQADRTYSLIERMRHHTLNVTAPDSLAFSLRLIDSYLQLFRSRKFNICGDETFDLGKGRSRAEADRRGVANLYADYVSALCRHLSDKGYEPMFWGDIAVELPEILGMLPKDVILLNWLYAPSIGDDKVRLVAESGAAQYVCSAVWCWNALLPRLDDAWNNISRLARYGMRYGAVGYLVTDWGDYGHVNDPRMAVAGMAYGAQCAWNPLAEVGGVAGVADAAVVAASDVAADVAVAEAAVSATAAANSADDTVADAAGDGATNPSSSEGDDYTGGSADQAAGAPADQPGAPTAAIIEMNRRIAAVEYGDRSGELLAALRDASCRVAFGFDDMVWYCEVDEGGRVAAGANAGADSGRFNRDAASAIHFGVHGFDGRYAAEWDARICAATSPDQARRVILEGLAPHIRRGAEANKALELDALRLGVAAARASRLGRAGDDVSAMLIALEGQRWFNLAGLVLAAREGFVGAATLRHAGLTGTGLTGVAGAAAGAAVGDGCRVARGLECWFESYADQWRTVSAESELNRIASIIWRIADALRAA